MPVIWVWQLHIPQQQADKEAGMVYICLLCERFPEAAVHAIAHDGEVRASFTDAAVCCFVFNT